MENSKRTIAIVCGGDSYAMECVAAYFNNNACIMDE